VLLFFLSLSPGTNKVLRLVRWRNCYSSRDILWMRTWRPLSLGSWMLFFFLLEPLLSFRLYLLVWLTFNSLRRLRRHSFNASSLLRYIKGLFILSTYIWNWRLFIAFLWSFLLFLLLSGTSQEGRHISLLGSQIYCLLLLLQLLVNRLSLSDFSTTTCPA
jgi:hypothetical protein